jgi:hypothetical protein
MPAEGNTSAKFAWPYQPEICGNFSNHVNFNLVTKIAMVTGKSNGNLVTKMTTANVGTLVTLILIIMSLMYLGLYVRCMLFLSDLTKLIFLDILSNTPQWELSCTIQMDGQTGMIMLNSCFLQLGACTQKSDVCLLWQWEFTVWLLVLQRYLCPWYAVSRFRQTAVNHLQVAWCANTSTQF